MRSIQNFAKVILKLHFKKSAQKVNLRHRIIKILPNTKYSWKKIPKHLNVEMLPNLVTLKISVIN